MTTQFDQYLEQIQDQAVAAYPLEAIWLITETGCLQVENIHEDPKNYFAVSERDTARAMLRGLLAVVHSHPDRAAAPSAMDMQGQINTNVPWGVLSTDGVVASEIAWWGTGVARQPLLGRGFRHGVTDCYGLIKDYYEIERGILLPDFPRDWQWWRQDQNLFAEGFPAAGFVRIDQKDAREGDVWMAHIGTDIPNHGGILLADGLALHHPGSSREVDSSKLSIREPIFRYQRLISHWLRYEGKA